MAKDVGLYHGVGVDNISGLYSVFNTRDLCCSFRDPHRSIHLAKETRTQWRYYMKRLLLIMILVVLMCGAGSQTMAQSGPRKVESGSLGVLSTTAVIPLTTESSRSILLGGNIAYTNVDKNWTGDVVTGFSQPVGSRLYLTGVGRFNKDKQLGVEIRSNYFLRPPSSGVNFFAVSGVGVDWRETADMTGTLGLGAMIPGEYTSPWAMLYSEPFTDVWEVGITVGILIMP